MRLAMGRPTRKSETRFMRSRGVFFVIIGFVGVALFGNSAVADALAQPLPSPTPVPVPIATATGSPNPDVSPIGTPPAAASPTASPTPLAVPIVLDRVRVGIVPGTTVTVSVSGGTGTIGVRASAPNVDVAYDPVAGKASLTGRAPGRASVTVFDDAGDTANVDVLVAPPAGVVPSDVTVELGGNVAPDFAVAKIQEAIAANAQLRPGTHVDVHGAQPSNALHAGDAFEAIARVHVDGANAYVDVNGATNVHLRVESFAQLNPELLDYSDDPESLERGIEGVLYRNELDAAKPARAYVYHISSNSSHDLYLVLRSGANEAHVQLIGSASGPSNAFGYVGHLSTLRYFLQRGAQESNVVDVTPDTPYVLRLGTRELHSQELVAGIFDARVLDGGPVELSVIGASLGTDPLSYAGLPEHAGDGHGRRGEFDLTAVPPMALTYVAGDRRADDPEFTSRRTRARRRLRCAARGLAQREQPGSRSRERLSVRSRRRRQRDDHDLVYGRPGADGNSVRDPSESLYGQRDRARSG